MRTDISRLEAQDPNWLVSLIQGGTEVPKALGKLISTIADQIGFSLEPLHIRRKAQAEADAATASAKAAGEIALFRAENQLALQAIEERAQERIRKREAKRQKNLEAIATKAAQAIPDSVSEKSVEEDWVAQFFEHCQDVSNDKMQTLWGKLLAGEVATPGTYSYRTLSAVKMLRPGNAQLFTQFCSFVWHDTNGFVPILAGPGAQLAEQQGLTFVSLLLLRQLGLIELMQIGSFSLKIQSPAPDAKVVIALNYYGRAHLLEFPPKIEEIQLGGALLTDIGRELAAISGATPNEEYRRALVDHWRAEKFEVQEL